MSQQTHPLYSQDRSTVDRLLACAAEPGPREYTDAARLIHRYQGFPGAEDIKQDLITLCRDVWGFSGRSELYAKTRQIWQSGWRPTQDHAEDVSVGSGADITQGEAA